MKTSLNLLLAAILASGASAATVELTPENFDAMTAGKTVRRKSSLLSVLCFLPGMLPARYLTWRSFILHSFFVGLYQVLCALVRLEKLMSGQEVKRTNQSVGSLEVWFEKWRRLNLSDFIIHARTHTDLYNSMINNNTIHTTNERKKQTGAAIARQ